MSRDRLFVEWLLLLTFSAIVAIWATTTRATSSVDLPVLDLATSALAGKPSDDILIVAIDDHSLGEVGPWPWERDHHARLVRQLDKAGAKAIFIDVLFTEARSEAGDAEMVQALEDAGNAVLPYTFGPAANQSNAFAPIYPIEPFAQSARAMGHVALELDVDGKVRKFDLEIVDGEARYPHFITAGLRAIGGPVAEAASTAPRAPLIPFHEPGAFRTVPASEVMAGRVPDAFIRDRFVLVGASAQGMGDRYATPGLAGQIMPGVELQANLFDALAKRNFVRPVSLQLQLSLTLLALLMLFIAFWRWPPRRALGLTALISLVIIVGSLLGVVLAGWWFAPAPALLALFASYPLWGWRRLSNVSRFLDQELKNLSPAIQGEQISHVEGFDIVAQQVERMKRLHRNVREGLTFLRQVIETAPDPILVFDEDGQLAMMNEEASRIFPGWNEDDQPTLEEMLLVDKAGLDETGGELTTADERSFLVSRASLDPDAEAESGEVMTLRDITAIRRGEAERQQMMEFLSHDMRTPQAAIIGLTEGGEKQQPTPDRLARIRTQAERTLKLADDFVQLARLNYVPLRPEFADVVAIVQEAIDRAYPAQRKKQIAIARDFSDDPIFAEIEPSLIARMLDNLIGNAIKFSPEGSTIAVRIAEVQVGAGGIEIAVADEGPGLPPERQQQPFARFGAHSSKAGPSVGLGLTFVARVVELHGGTIEVNSSEALGTRFRIVIPEAGKHAD
ncbi:MAG: CHASE2 domain-containing protein [Sphingomonadaceae bacterium]